ncbi:MAG: hypothetical protein JRI23_02655, partial [Deltaproteobacteria bacterium]|nr:hypothetical protein [Deltaproteobacteria bacterium]MBW2530401.1 hypothetical protein [Deltaproteobacteria bacterium]
MPRSPAAKPSRWVPPILAAVWLLAALPSPAAAAPAPLATTRVPASKDQHALAVRLAPPLVLARACGPRERCRPEGGSRFPLPDEAVSRAAAATVRTHTLTGGQRVVEVSVPGNRPDERYVQLLAATARPGDPAVLHPLKGWLGRPRGKPGRQRTDLLLYESAGGRAKRLVLGSRHEHISLCGRPATIRTRRLDPTRMEWIWTGARTLSAAERAQATVLEAARSDARWTDDEPRVLRAVAASSAAGDSVAALTDGDRTTAWSPDRPGGGAGEFALMSAPPTVPIRALDFVFRPTSSAGTPSAAPSRVLVVTDEHSFAITIPDDPASQPRGQPYRVQLPEPLRSSCVAVVLDAGEGRQPADRVTIAEVRARTDFDGAAGWSALLVALDGSEDAARAAEATLRRGGEPAV